MIPRAQAGWEQELELAGGEEATASLVSGSGGGGGRRLKRKTPESVAALLGNLMGPSGALGNLGVGAPLGSLGSCRCGGPLGSGPVPSLPACSIRFNSGGLHRPRWPKLQHLSIAI